MRELLVDENTAGELSAELRRVVGDSRLRWASRGPLLDRMWFEARTEHLFVELRASLSPLRPLSASAQYIGAVRPLFRSRSAAFCLPDQKLVESEGALVYRLPPAQSLYAAWQAEETLPPPDAYAELGRILAGLHASPLPEAVSFPRVPLFSLGTLEDAGDGDESRRHLDAAFAVCERLTRLASDAEANMLSAAPVSVLHGRWSAGSIFLGASGESKQWIVLGGADCWLGPREYDLAYLIGELIEMAAHGALCGESRQVEYARNAITSFVAGYRSRSECAASGLPAFVALRLVTHVMLNCWWRALHWQASPGVSEWIRALTALEVQCAHLEELLTI